MANWDQGKWDQASWSTIDGVMAAAEEGSDTFAGAGAVAVIGQMAVQEAGDDTFAGAGAVVVGGQMAAVETGNDQFAGAGVVNVSGVMAAVETAPDVFAASGSVFIVGTMAAQEVGQDTFAAIGFIGDGAPQAKGWIPQIERKRRWEDEAVEQQRLRKSIEQAIEPITEANADVVTVKGEVAVVTKSRAIELPVPPQFDVQAVAKMAVSVLEAAGIEAKRVRDAKNRRRAMLALEAERVENERRLRKRRRDEEILLLME